MACNVYDLGTLKNYKYVVVLSVYKGMLMLSKHNFRTSWETQGGHIEEGETPLEAAKRELYEESGAVDYTIEPIFDYRSGDEKNYADGQVFLAHTKRLEPIPEDSEMRDVGFFEYLPHSLTYHKITPVLFAHAKKLGLLDYEEKYHFS